MATCFIDIVRIGDSVGEGVFATKVRVRYVLEGPVGVEGRRAMLWAIDHDCHGAASIHVLIVPKHPGRCRRRLPPQVRHQGAGRRSA